MAQFCVYENTNRTAKRIYPFLLDMQADLLDELQTTVVIPLSPSSIIGQATITKLCPIVEIDNINYIVLTQQITGVDRKVLGQKVYNLSHYRSELISAIDFILSEI